MGTIHSDLAVPPDYGSRHSRVSSGQSFHVKDVTGVAERDTPTDVQREEHHTF